MEHSEQFLLSEKTRLLKKYQCKDIDELIEKLQNILNKQILSKNQ